MITYCKPSELFSGGLLFRDQVKYFNYFKNDTINDITLTLIRKDGNW